MFNVEEIKARMRKGESIDDIANDLASALNTAEKEMEEEAKKAREEAARLETEAQLDALADVIVDSISNYIKIAAPDLAARVNSEEVVNGADLRENIDSMIYMMRLLAPVTEKAKEVKKTPAQAYKFDPDAIIQAFLKEL